MNQRKAGAILSYIGFLINNITGLIYTPYMLRMMGQSEYGIHGTAGSMTAYLSLLTFGIGGAYLRYNAKCRANHDVEGERRLNGIFLLVFSVLSGLVVLLGGGMVLFAKVLVGNEFTATELSRLQIVMILGVVSMVITFMLTAIHMCLQAYERYFYIRVVHLIAGIATPIINVVALMLGGRAVALSVCSLVLSIFCEIAYIIYAVKVLGFKMSFKGIKFEYVKDIFIFSSFLFMDSITDQITHSTDNIVLAAFDGPTAVAIYTVGAHFRGYFLNFSTSISSVFAPQIHGIVAKTQGKDNRPLNEIFIRVGRIQFYVLSLVLIGFLSIGRDFIRIWAGPDYTSAYTIGWMLMVAIYVPLFQNVGLDIQKAKNMHKARSVVYLIIAIANVAATIPLTKMWGGVGAALATMICMLLGNTLFMNWYYATHIGLDILGFWKSIARILPGFVAPCALGFVFNRFWRLNSYLDILLAAGAITVVYCASIWLFSMNKYEKNLVSSPVKKLLRRR